MQPNRVWLVPALSLIAGPLTARPPLVTPPVAPLGPQSITPLAVEGDTFASGETIARVDQITLASEGIWYVRIRNDYDQFADHVVLGPDGVAYRDGDPLTASAGFVETANAPTLNQYGAAATSMFVDIPYTEDGITTGFLDLLIGGGTVSNAPSLPPGSRYQFFQNMWFDGDRIATWVSFENGSALDHAIMELELGPSGSLVSEKVLVREGGLLPGNPDPIEFVAGSFAVDGDRFMFAARTRSTYKLYLDGVVVAEEDRPSPVAGRNWLYLSYSKCTIAGSHYAHRGVLDGPSSTAQILIKNGQKFVQAGDVLPAIGEPLSSFENPPMMQLSEDGELLWLAEWPGASALFLDYDMILQAGIPLLGSTLQWIEGNSLRLSRDGQHVAFIGHLADGREGAFLLDVGLGTNYCVAARSSLLDVPATITAAGSASISAGDLTLYANPVPVQPGIFYCGPTAVQVPFGSGFRCVGGSITRFGVLFPRDGLARHDLDPAANGLQPGTHHFQYWYRDGGGTFNLSDGVSISLTP